MLAPKLYDSPRFGLIDAVMLPKGDEYTAEDNSFERMIFLGVWICVLFLALRYVRSR